MDDAFDYTIEMPLSLAGGVYANKLVVWHSPYEFTLDFCAYDGSDDGVDSSERRGFGSLRPLSSKSFESSTTG